VENSNRVSEVRLNEDLTAGSVDEVITDPAFHTPSTAIRFDGGLAVVNAKFDTGIPPTADRRSRARRRLTSPVRGSAYGTTSGTNFWDSLGGRM
jgi:hypothetical protein